MAWKEHRAAFKGFDKVRKQLGLAETAVAKAVGYSPAMYFWWKKKGEVPARAMHVIQYIKRQVIKGKLRNQFTKQDRLRLLKLKIKDLEREIKLDRALQRAAQKKIMERNREFN